jgi:hypothetical protein
MPREGFEPVKPEYRGPRIQTFSNIRLKSVCGIRQEEEEEEEEYYKFQGTYI